MKKFVRKLLIMVSYVLFLLPLTMVDVGYASQSITNWEYVYDNPDGAYNGEIKTWDASEEGKYSIPEWSALKNPEFKIRLLGDINAVATKGDVVRFLFNIWKDMLDDQGYFKMKESSTKPNFKDFNNLVEQAQIDASILFEKGILNGIKKDDGMYLNLGDPLKRCELAVILTNFNIMLWNLPKVTEYGHTKDVHSDKICYWAKDYVYYVIQHNLMSGVADKIFNPEGLVKIVEVCEVAIRLIDSNGIAAKNVLEKIEDIFPITSDADFVSDKKTAIPVSSIRFTENSSGFGYISWGMANLEVFPSEAMRYLDLRIKDNNLKTGSQKSLNIVKVFDRATIGQNNILGIELNALCPGNVTLEVRTLDGSNTIITNEIGPRPINYSQYTFQNNTLVFNVLGEIETDMSKIPNNYRDYPYILNGIEKSVYELPFYRNENKGNQFGPLIAYSKFSYIYEGFARKIQNYYNAVLNIDYETIELEKFNKDLNNELPGESSISKYIEYVKKYKIKTKGTIEIYLPIIFYDYMNFYVRTRIKLNILSSDTNKDLLLGDYTTLGYIYYDTNFDFIADIPISFDFHNILLIPGPLAIASRTDSNIRK